MNITERILLTVEMTEEEADTMRALAQSENRTESSMLEELIKNFLAKGVPTPTPNNDEQKERRIA